MFEHFVIDTITIIILQADKFLKCDSLRPVIIKPNLKYLHVKITLLCSINRRQHGFFKTPQISLAAAAARDILVNFEISLAVFVPNVLYVPPLETVLFPVCRATYLTLAMWH